METKVFEEQPIKTNIKHIKLVLMFILAVSRLPSAQSARG